MPAAGTIGAVAKISPEPSLQDLSAAFGSTPVGRARHNTRMVSPIGTSIDVPHGIERLQTKPRYAALELIVVDFPGKAQALCRQCGSNLESQLREPKPGTGDHRCLDESPAFL